MRLNKIFRVTILGLFVLSCAAAASMAQEAPTAKEPDPLVVLRQMCDYLKSLPQFSYHAEVADDQVYLGGKKLQYGIDMDTYVKRPDTVRVNAVGDLVNKEFFLNGATLTLYDKDKNVYATMEVPTDIEGALEKANKDFGVRVALTDLASPRLWDQVSSKIGHSLYVGMSNVRGIPCHHLAFDGKDVQIQVWVDAGKEPLPRKVVFTSKDQEGSPQWTAYLNEWKIDPHLQDALFTFTPPEGVRKIKFAQAKQPPAPAEEKGGKS
jgi:hypothetical protein